MYISLYIIACLIGGAENKRKALPKWLREELEKMEKKRQKALAKGSQEVANRERVGLGREKPAWRDEESDPEEEEEEEKRRAHMLATKDLPLWQSQAKISSELYTIPKSVSPDVSGLLFLVERGRKTS